jgi:hypothetical protein
MKILPVSVLQYVKDIFIICFDLRLIAFGMKPEQPNPVVLIMLLLTYESCQQTSPGVHEASYNWGFSSRIKPAP